MFSDPTRAEAPFGATACSAGAKATWHAVFAPAQRKPVFWRRD
jgi:hypothetical protein